MKQLVIILGIILIVGHLLTEVHGIIYDIYPKINTINLDLFWKKNFHFDLSLHWWIKDLCDSMLLIIVFFVMAKIAYQYSYTLFLISVIYMIYHVIDLCLFMYNYKQTKEIYWVLLAATIASTGLLIFHKRKKDDNKIKSIL
jgi:hypothetical protein